MPETDTSIQHHWAIMLTDTADFQTNEKVKCEICEAWNQWYFEILILRTNSRV